MHKNDGELFSSKFAEVNKERQCDKALCKKSRKIKKTNAYNILPQISVHFTDLYKSVKIHSQVQNAKRRIAFL